VSLVVLSHHSVADCAVTDVGRDVHRHSATSERVEKGREGIRRPTVLADDDGGDPLVESPEPVVAANQCAVGVAVRVDESGCQGEPTAVHHCLAGSRCQGSHLGDPIARHADGGRSRVAAGAIEQ